MLQVCFAHFGVRQEGRGHRQTPSESLLTSALVGYLMGLVETLWCFVGLNGAYSLWHYKWFCSSMLFLRCLSWLSTAHKSHSFHQLWSEGVQKNSKNNFYYGGRSIQKTFSSSLSIYKRQTRVKCAMRPQGTASSPMGTEVFKRQQSNTTSVWSQTFWHQHTHHPMEYSTLLEVKSLTACLSTFLLISALNQLCNFKELTSCYQIWWIVHSLLILICFSITR